MRKYNETPPDMCYSGCYYKEKIINKIKKTSKLLGSTYIIKLFGNQDGAPHQFKIELLYNSTISHLG